MGRIPTRDRVGYVVCVMGVLGAVAAGFVEWRIHGPYGESDSRIWRSVDPGSGQTVIAFNARGYGRPNIWCFLEGTRLARMEFDQDGDGVIDRWEYYASDGTLDRAFQRDASGERVLVASEQAVDDTPRLRR
jgi:hypothetical protein